MKNKLQDEMWGDIPSYTHKDEGIEGYITNYGSVEVNLQTGEVHCAAIGLGRDYGNTPMTMKIDGREFQVIRTQSQGSTMVARYDTPGYPNIYPRMPEMELMDVILMLSRDTNDHYAAKLVKKTFVSLVMNKCSLTLQEDRAIKSLLQSWRSPITGKRQPIRG